MIKKSPWVVYLLACKDGSYYTGTTNNLDKRIKKHLTGKGSKYVHAKGYKTLIGFKTFNNRSKACMEEYRIKKLRKDKKLAFFT